MLAKPYPMRGPTYLPLIPNDIHCMSRCAHEVLGTILEARLMPVRTYKSTLLYLLINFFLHLHVFCAATLCHLCLEVEGSFTDFDFDPVSGLLCTSGKFINVFNKQKPGKQELQQRQGKPKNLSSSSNAAKLASSDLCFTTVSTPPIVLNAPCVVPTALPLTWPLTEHSKRGLPFSCCFPTYSAAAT